MNSNTSFLKDQDNIIYYIITSFLEDQDKMSDDEKTEKFEDAQPILHVGQCFLNHGLLTKSGSPRLCRWVAKACKLSRVNEKDLCAEDLRSEEPF